MGVLVGGATVEVGSAVPADVFVGAVVLVAVCVGALVEVGTRVFVAGGGSVGVLEGGALGIGV